MFQGFTKIFSKPKPEFSRSKILSFIENYDYLKGRKDPGATGLITVLSKSECRVNLKNDVNSLNSLDNLLDLVRAITYLGVKITNEDEVRKWVRLFLKNGLIEAYFKNPFDETRNALRIAQMIGSIFSVSEKKRMGEYYKEILFKVIRDHKAPSSNSVIYLLNTCVLAMTLAGYKFTSQEKEEILGELMKFREDDVVFRSRSYVDRRARFNADRESEDAYDIIEALDFSMAQTYRDGFVKRSYEKGRFFSLQEEMRNIEKKNVIISFGDIYRAARYHKNEHIKSKDEILGDIVDFYDGLSGGFYYYSFKDRKKMPAQDRIPELNATFLLVQALAYLQYDFQP